MSDIVFAEVAQDVDAKSFEVGGLRNFRVCIALSDALPFADGAATHPPASVTHGYLLSRREEKNV